MDNNFGNNADNNNNISNSTLDDFSDNQDFDDFGEENETEDDDPKKEIQRLTGKLSQKVRTYNDEQEKPDTELNKYVAGMIIPQTTKSMVDKDKKEIIKKIENGEVDDSNFDKFNDDENPMDKDSEMGNDEQNELDMPNEKQNESYRYITKKKINEMLNDINNKKQSIRKDKKLKQPKQGIRNPFVY